MIQPFFLVPPDKGYVPVPAVLRQVRPYSLCGSFFGPVVNLGNAVCTARIVIEEFLTTSRILCGESLLKIPVSFGDFF
jgi:hypothetical protein